MQLIYHITLPNGNIPSSLTTLTYLKSGKRKTEGNWQQVQAVIYPSGVALGLEALAGKGNSAGRNYGACPD